jgi:hypothetical protein
VVCSVVRVVQVVQLAIQTQSSLGPETDKVDAQTKIGAMDAMQTNSKMPSVLNPSFNRTGTGWCCGGVCKNFVVQT